MTSRPSRREFVASALAAGAGARLAWAIEPIKHSGKAKLTPSLAAYSFNRYLALKSKNKPTMTLEDFIDLCAKLELPATELTAYYFPKETDEYLKSVKKRCEDNKLAVSGTAIGNDFCWPDKAKQKEQMEYVTRWIEHSALLGAKTMRIFAGTVRKGDSEDDARKRAIDAIGKACEVAGKHKLILALENHGGITATSEQFLAIVKAVKSDWFGVNLDTGNFRTKDPYADLEKAAPYAVVVQIKTEVFIEQPAGKDKAKASYKREEADFGKLTKMLRAMTFQGYVALEYEAQEDPRTAVPKYVKQLKKYTD
jgi:sugar phosphate isomerase/epimerase